ncbi:LacI family DNA-binding transcriptional regulator [Pseudovibrio sp. Tun.PSC04-5.I4]|uniref:LacI family DNA-binding transcriptional regulator n=1 Tax=Pseudovibrio sp. Tun.PSC04-5.I4 TaxID=1798213 RepID=UPI00089081B2|nr:LacI family DNA-binding transcriptional regulator [Pseudovibrio sp. Tun.PSC04-5.I4]SDQ74583.1 transcriptional regulator, LacI family [Pseudovibrio sp. Tun.PSC04-5.I4]
MVTITDISRRAGVSPSVVSRIVNGDEKLRVSADTRARVEAIIEETGYKPNVAARSLRSSKSGLLALVVHDVANPVYAEIIAGAQSAASEYGKVLLVGEAASIGSSVTQLESLIAGGGVDGLVLQGAGTELDRSIEHAVSRKIPLVFLQSGDINLAPVLSMDDKVAGYMATEHLLNRGHKKVGCITTKRGLQFSEARLEGWKMALLEQGIQPDETCVIPADPNHASGYLAVKQLFEASPETTAVVVSNVLSAVGVLAYLADSGKSVPDDVSVIAINDTDVAEYIRPALTSIKMPLHTMGAEAVRLVCAGKPLDHSEIKISDPSPILIERSSVSRL